MAGMKFSISVPDELWESARAVVTEDSPSAVVQAALRQIASGVGAEHSYEVPPSIEGQLRTSLAQSAERLASEAQALYQEGYRGGVKLAARLSWAQLSWVVHHGVLAAAKLARREGEAERGEIVPAKKPIIELKQLIESDIEIASSADWLPHEVAARGIDRALRDLWQTIHSPIETIGSTPRTGTHMTSRHGVVRRPGGIMLPYRVLGAEDGHRMLFAHALLDNARDTEPLVGPLLDAGWQVLLMDQRGHGQASAVPRPDQLTLEEMAGDLLALLDEVGWRTAWFAGGSMGAATALAAATQCPDRVEGLGLIVPGFGSVPNPAAERFDRIAAVIAAEGITAARAEWTDQLTQAGLLPEQAALMIPALETMDPDTVCNLLTTVFRWTVADQLTQLRGMQAPVVVIGWEGDDIHPAAVAQEIASLAPVSRLRILPSRPTEVELPGALLAELAGEFVSHSLPRDEIAVERIVDDDEEAR